MPRIKLCGLFREEDIEYANQAKPDFVGFIFAESRRKITPEKAAAFRKKLDTDIPTVGVFVNHEISEIEKLVNDGTIQFVQLHGEEDEVYINELKRVVDVPVIKAVRVKSTSDILEAVKLPVDYLLLDTYSEKEKGGTGEVFDWSIIPEIKKPYFLAGGLNLENIEKALKYDAYCYDVSSGVETDGIKDRDKMIEIVRKIR